MTVKGIVFILRSSEKITLTFQIYTNENMIFSTIKNVEKNTDESIEMFFDNSKPISKNATFKIKITEENKNKEK